MTVVIYYGIISKGEKSYDSFYTNEIIGVIDNIRFGDKKQAIVQIRGKEYSLLLFGLRKGQDLHVGDSLYKAQNSKTLELHSKTANGGFIFTQIYQMK